MATNSHAATYSNDDKEIEEIELVSSDDGKVWDKSRELVFETRDGWYYRFRELVPGEGFEFHHKRRPDMEISDDDVVPRSIINYFANSNEYSLLDEKTQGPANRL